MIDEAAPDSKRDTMQLRLTVGVAVAAAMIAAVVLRGYKLDASLWLDEVLTHEGAYQGILGTLAHRVYPLYYVLASIPLRWDDSEVMLRLPSLLAGVATVPAIYFLGKSAGGRGVGLVSALLLMGSAYHIRYSQEARYYGLVMLGGALMTWFLYRAITQGGKKNWLPFVLASFFSLLTQVSVTPFFAAVVLGAGVWILVTRSPEPLRMRWRHVVPLGLAALAGASGLITTVTVTGGGVAFLNVDSSGAAEMTHDDVAFDGESSGEGFELTLPKYGGYILDFTPLRPAGVRYVLALLACAGFVSLWSANRALAVLFMFQFLVAPLPYFLLSSSHWYASRYFCNLTPLYFVLIAAGIVAIAAAVSRLGDRVFEAMTGRATARRGRGQQAVTVVLTLMALTALAPFLAGAMARYYDRRPVSDWKALADYMAGGTHPGDVIVLLTPLTGPNAIGGVREPPGNYQLPLHYYLTRSLPRYFPDNHYAVMGSLSYAGADTPADIRGLAVEHKGQTLWFVMRNEKEYPREYVRAVRQAGATEKRRFGKMIVRHRPIEERKNLPDSSG